LGGQVPITGGGRCPLWGGQVLIIGGSGAYYRGFRCQLWGCQEPMTGASGAHHRGMWRWCEALELDTNMPLTTSRVKHVNEPYSALSQPPSSPSNRYSFCASSSHCVTYTTRQFASLNSVSGLISKIERRFRVYKEAPGFRPGPGVVSSIWYRIPNDQSELSISKIPPTDSPTVRSTFH